MESTHACVRAYAWRALRQRLASTYIICITKIYTLLAVLCAQCRGFMRCTLLWAHLCVCECVCARIYHLVYNANMVLCAGAAALHRNVHTETALSRYMDAHICYARGII